jgi:hypothetical protein
MLDVSSLSEIDLFKHLPDSCLNGGERKRNSGSQSFNFGAVSEKNCAILGVHPQLFQSKFGPIQGRDKWRASS